MSSKQRALIVEDEYLIAADLEDALGRSGFEVCGVAADGDTARSLAMKYLPALVLMDVCLEGGREGIEIARWIAEVCNASIIFVTANTDTQTHSRVFVSGSREHLCWPSLSTGGNSQTRLLRHEVQAARGRQSLTVRCAVSA